MHMKIFSLLSDHPIVESFLVECQYPRTVWQSVDDGESYVRASALATIGLMAESEAIWENITVQIKEVNHYSSALLGNRLKQSFNFESSKFIHITLCTWNSV